MQRKVPCYLLSFQFCFGPSGNFQVNENMARQSVVQSCAPLAAVGFLVRRRREKQTKLDNRCGAKNYAIFRTMFYSFPDKNWRNPGNEKRTEIQRVLA